jgi:hypothetical protein
LPPFADGNSTVIAALMEIGQQGGILDAHDDLAAGPKALIIDPAVNGNPASGNSYGTNPDNPAMTAGPTFVGQFTDRDIAFDQTSQLGVTQNPLTSPNARTPALDLDSAARASARICMCPTPTGRSARSCKSARAVCTRTCRAPLGPGARVRRSAPR